MFRSKAAETPAATRDIGNIAVMEDSDGVVARRNDFDLDQKTLTFRPSGVNASQYQFQLQPPSYDAPAASNGVALSGMGDDDSRAVPLPFPFPFFGQIYQQVYVNSDGNLTFTAGDSASTDRSLGRMVAGVPRIAPLFEDLNPAQAGSIRIAGDSNRIAITWVQVPEYSDFNTGALQTFQVRLYPDGTIDFSYNGISTTGAVVGITPGGLQGSTTVLSFVAGGTATYSSTVVERFGAQSEVDTITVAQKFYQTHDDAYDYLVIFNNEGIPAGGTAVSWESTVRNNRSGYGDSQIDIGSEYGSAARLQAVLNMGYLSQFPTDPTAIVPARSTSRDTPISVIAHETGHLFLAYASTRDPYDPSARPMLGFQSAHWNFAFNSDASLLEGNRIRDDGPAVSPRFTTIGTVQHYSNLDQYLMGFRAPEEVALDQYQMFLVTGVPASFKQRGPQSGVSFDGQRQDIQIQDIIQGNGLRVPDYTVAQRHFRFAFIMIVPQGTDPSAGDLAKLESFRSNFEAFYAQAASNRAFADASLRKALRLSIFPAAGVIPGQSATVSISVQTQLTAPLDVTLQAPNGNASVPSVVTIPGGATSATFNITGVRAGVEEIAATPVNTSYAVAYARVQVFPVSSLQLVPVSGDRQLSNSAAALPNPVIIKLTDANNLPYPGVRIQCQPSVGGSVVPQVAATDANGQVSILWTPGTTPGPQLRFFLEGAPNGLSLVVGTGSGLISTDNVLNAASPAPTVAVGGYGAVYGKNLAGGVTIQTQPPWPNSLANVQVTLGGRVVSLLYVSDAQIDFYVPLDFPVGPADLVVSSPYGASPAFRVQVAAQSPGIFSLPPTAFGAIRIAGTALTTSDRPARAREYVEIYCTGLGAVRNSSIPGLKETTLSPQVTIGGLPAQVTFSGLVPGYLGFYQVDVQIPDGLSTGALDLFLTINGIKSNTVKIGVQ